MNASETMSLILHVDDTPDELASWQQVVEARGGARLLRLHPDEVTEEHLRDADLALVDYKLDPWPTRDRLHPLSLRPSNGVALLTILQEHNHHLRAEHPCAFALYTAVIGDVARGLVHKEHLVARAHNLEWVFPKQGDPDEKARRVIELASAVRALPAEWPWQAADDAERALWQWLALPTEAWTSDAQRDVRRCYPPAHELANHTHGVAVLRWFLHRILPYPCFLYDEHHLAARLRVTVSSLHDALQKGGGLSHFLDRALYRGQLSTFLGLRWWRSGVEASIFDLVAQDPGNVDLLKERLRDLDPRLAIHSERVLVPVLDGRYEFLPDLVSIDRTVLVQPDDWPTYADQAWTTNDLAANDAILKAVVCADT